MSTRTGRAGPTGAPRAGGAPAALDRGRIVSTAVAVADVEGLEGLSIRRLAGELGVGPMSLYRHVRDKDDLVLQMTDAALREWRPPAPDDSPWQERLEAGSRGLWTVFRRHPWVAPTLSLTRPQPLAGGLAYAEWVLATLAVLDLARDEVFDVYVLLFAYIRGMAINLESEAAAEAATGVTGDQFVDLQAQERRDLVATGDHPHFQQMVTTDYDFDLDRLYAKGLRHLLHGIAARVSGSQPAEG